MRRNTHLWPRANRCFGRTSLLCPWARAGSYSRCRFPCLLLFNYSGAVSIALAWGALLCGFLWRLSADRSFPWISAKLCLGAPVGCRLLLSRIQCYRFIFHFHYIHHYHHFHLNIHHCHPILHYLSLFNLFIDFFAKN